LILGALDVVAAIRSALIDVAPHTILTKRVTAWLLVVSSC